MEVHRRSVRNDRERPDLGDGGPEVPPQARSLLPGKVGAARDLEALRKASWLLLKRDSKVNWRKPHEVDTGRELPGYTLSLNAESRLGDPQI